MQFTHMKISVLFIAFLLVSLFSSAQIERKPTVVKADSAQATAPADKSTARQSRRDLLKDLDLTKEQRSKLKEMRQANQAAKEAIENNAQLSDAEKKNQLRVLQKEQAQKIQSVLTEEQKLKFKEGRQNNP